MSRNPKEAKPASWAAMTDLQLLAGIRERKEEAFTALVARYHVAFVRLARFHVSSTDLAEEVAQETWMAVLNGIDRFEARSSLKTWLFSILVNKAKTRGQREARHVTFSALEDEDDPLAHRFTADGSWGHPPEPVLEGTPESAALSRELGDLIRQAIDILPPSQRAVILLRDIEGLSAEEACNILELSESNQRVLLHRGRTRLRALLESSLPAEQPRKR